MSKHIIQKDLKLGIDFKILPDEPIRTSTGFTYKLQFISEKGLHYMKQLEQESWIETDKEIQEDIENYLLWGKK